MVLTLTQYFDAEPGHVANKLHSALNRGLDAAADRIGATRSDLLTEGITDGVRLNGGLNILDGSEIHVSGEYRLTTLQITVPWEHTNESKALAASAFAHAIANEVQLAA